MTVTGTTAVCRSCGGAIFIVLSLGSTPLANRLLTREQLDQPEPRYPLDLAFCPACTLVQITETVPPEELFSEYVYFSSYSDTALENARTIVERMVGQRSLGANDLVLEIASNDGYLLQYYLERGVPVLGIEPAANIAAVARSRGIDTTSEFFGAGLARRLADGGIRPSVLHANNVLAHVADLNGVVGGIAIILSDDGMAVIEVPYLLDLIDRCEFDTIYHEHLCYFSVTSLRLLLERHGLVIADVERIPIHGGSLRLFVGHAGRVSAGERVEAQLEEERRWGVNSVETYQTFGASVKGLGERLRALLTELKSSGVQIAAYGASAKGSTLLNVLGIDGTTLDFVVDRSVAKQGKFTPGTHLPIYPPGRLLDESPDFVLLLTWNFAEEILRQQEEFRRLGGRFIIPVPEPMVV
ncbi:MAG: class I SAM-dependent methyltransferase [Acidobacteriota bacterium]